jgi:hypothetical protein
VYDNITRSVRIVLIQRDAGTIEADEVLTRLSSAVPAFTEEQITLLASLPIDTWTRITDAGRAVLETTLAGEVRDDELADARRSPTSQRPVAAAARDGQDLAAAQVAPTCSCPSPDGKRAVSPAVRRSRSTSR